MLQMDNRRKWRRTCITVSLVRSTGITGTHALVALSLFYSQLRYYYLSTSKLAYVYYCLPVCLHKRLVPKVIKQTFLGEVLVTTQETII